MTPSPDPTLRIAAICGSARTGNYTSRALAIALDELGQYPDVEVQMIDPAQMDLRFPGLGRSESASPLQQTIEAADGVLLATPEYHGSFSGLMKLVIENLGFPSKLSGKPVTLLGVAAGSIGAIKSLEQLRSVCSHVGALVLPGSVSVANVRTKFDDDGKCLDPKVEERIRGLSESLLDYVRRHVCPFLTLEAMVREG